MKNAASPFTLAVQPDGALKGSGSVDVAGRVVSGSTANGIAFAPRSIRCAIGNLIPKRGAAAPVVDHTPPTGAATPAGGMAALSLSAAGLPAQPGNPSPLAGITMYLLKESFAGILTKSGMRPAAGMTVIQAWGAACEQHAPECTQAMTATLPYVANKVKCDLDGKASFPAMPSATYHLFGWTVYNRRHLLWDLRVDLKPGANGVALDQRNAILLN